MYGKLDFYFETSVLHQNAGLYLQYTSFTDIRQPFEKLKTLHYNIKVLIWTNTY